MGVCTATKIFFLIQEMFSPCCYKIMVAFISLKLGQYLEKDQLFTHIVFLYKKLEKLINLIVN